MPLCLNYNTGELGSQEEFELIDGHRDWRKRKVMSIKVSKLMRKYDPERAELIRRCGTYLGFRQTPDGKRNLETANFCRQRLCPMCQWRRSLRLSVQADKIYRALAARGYKFVFVTVTLRNCSGVDLLDTCEEMYRRAAEFQRSRRFKESFAGFYRAFEITYNECKGTYHPHFHYLMAVTPEYFAPESPIYWTTDLLIKRWRKAAHLDYDPSVSVEAVRQKEGQSITSACVELCKYPAKTAEINQSGVLRFIDLALRSRRLIAWGGVVADVRRELSLEDVEDGDLVHADDERTEYDEDAAKVVYVWRHGLYLPLDLTTVREIREAEEYENA